MQSTRSKHEVSFPKKGLISALFMLALISGASLVHASMLGTSRSIAEARPFTSLIAAIRSNAFSYQHVGNVAIRTAFGLPYELSKLRSLASPAVESIPTDLASNSRVSVPGIAIAFPEAEPLVALISEVSHLIKFPSLSSNAGFALLDTEARTIEVAGMNISLVGGIMPSEVLPQIFTSATFDAKAEVNGNTGPLLTTHYSLLTAFTLPRVAQAELLPLNAVHSEQYAVNSNANSGYCSLLTAYCPPSAPMVLGVNTTAKAAELAGSKVTLPFFDRFSLSFYCAFTKNKIDAARCNYDAVAGGFVAYAPSGNDQPATGGESASPNALTPSFLTPSPVYITKYVTEYVPVPGPRGRDGRDGKDGSDGITTLNNIQAQPGYGSFIIPSITYPNNTIGISTISYLKDVTIDTPRINGGTAIGLSLTNSTLENSTMNNTVFNGMSFFNDTVDMTGATLISNLSATSSILLDAILTNSTTTNAFITNLAASSSLFDTSTTTNAYIAQLAVSSSTFVYSTTTNAYITNLFVDAATSTDSYITRLVAASSTLTDAMLTNSTTTNSYIANLVAASSTLVDLITTNAVFTNSTTTNSYITNLFADNATTTRLFVQSLSVGSSTSGNMTITGDLIVQGTTTLATTTVTQLTAGDFAATNATTTSLFASLLTALTGFFTDLTAINATTTNLFTQNLAVGNASTTGNQSIDGEFRVTGTSTMQSNVFLNGNVVIGTSSNEMFTVNALVNSDFSPAANKMYDLGSPSFYWRSLYADSINVNSISAASTTISGTSNNSFTINSDNASSDTEDMSLVFFRGLVNPNAVIRWNSTAKRFEANQSFLVMNETPSIGTTTLTVQGGVGQGNTNLFELKTNAGMTTSVFNANGWLGIGSSTPGSALSVIGNGYFGGNLTATGTLNISGQTTLTNASTTNLTVTSNAYFGGNTGIWNSSGNVGIGTTTPVAKLSVLGQSGNTMPNFLVASSTNAAQFTVLANGNVGIGMIAPTVALDVIGDAQVTGRILLPNGSLTLPSLQFGGVSNSLGFYKQTTNELAIAGNGSDRIGYFKKIGNDGQLLMDQSSTVATAAQRPAYTFTDDDDTGMFLYNTGILGFTTNGTTGMVINANGNVGIGSTTPGAKLSVNGGGYFGGNLTATGTLNVFGQTILTNASTTNLTVTSNAYFGGNTGIWNSSGNVGIGTTTPHTKLTFASSTSSIDGIAFGSDISVYRAAANYLAFTGGSLGVGIDTNSGLVYGQGFANGGSANNSFVNVGTFGTIVSRNVADSNAALLVDQVNAGSTGDILRLRSNSIDRMVVTQAGNVGIGTTTPTSNLFVQGFGANPSFTVASSTGASQFTVLANGNVGIGTAAPGALLDVNIGNADINPMYIRRGANNSNLIRFYINTTAISTIDAPSSNTRFYAASGRTLSLGAGGNTDSILIDALGNVGIGTLAPTQKLEVAGNIAPSIDSLYDLGTSTSRWNTLYVNTIISTGTISGIINPGFTAGSVVFASTSGALTQNNSQFFWDNTNNRLGIGTTSPSSRLFVQGSGITSGSSALNVVNASGTSALFVRDDGAVAIGATSGLLNKLHVVGGGTFVSGHTAGSINIGADVASTIRTANVRKLATITAPDYTNSNLQMELLTMDSDTATTNRLYLGGRIGGSNFGATSITLSTNSSTSTTGGTARLHIDSTGNVGIGTSSPSSNLFVSGFGTNPSFTVASSTGASQFTVLAGGNVGIGTSSPESRFTIGGFLPSGTGANDITPGTYQASIGGAANSGGLLITGVSTTLSSGQSVLRVHANSSTEGNLALFTSNSSSGNPVMALKSTGNVGIGTNAPSRRLEIAGDDNSTYEPGTSTIGILLRNGSGTALPARQTDIIFAGSNLTSTGNYAAITGVVTGSSGSGQIGSIVFSTKTGVANTALTERMRIDRDGNVGIGTSTPEVPLHVSSALAAGVIIDRTSASNAGIQFRNTLGSMYSGISSAGNFGIGNSANLTTAYLTVQSATGNVGIGSTTPGSTLSVVGMSGVNTPNFTVASSSGATQFTVLANGNVGIGTTSPTAKQTIQTLTTDAAQTLWNILDASSTALFSARITSTGTGAPTFSIGANPVISGIGTGLVVDNGSPIIAQFSRSGTSTMVNITGGSFIPQIQITQSGKTFTTSVSSNTFRITDGTAPGTNDRLVIDNTGNVGIGTTTPAQRLDVWGNLRVGTGTAPALFVNTATGNIGMGTANPAFGLSTVSGTAGVSRRISVGDIPDRIVLGYDSAGIQSNVAYSQIIETGTALQFAPRSNLSSVMSFFTNNPSATTTPQERLRIDQNGNIGIGMTTPTQKLVVAGNIAPSADSLYDLGTSTSRWNNLFVNAITATSSVIDNSTSTNLFATNASFTNLNVSSINPGFTPGSVVFASSTGSLAQNNNQFFWDNTNNRLGIGTSTPEHKLDVAGTANIFAARISNTSWTSAASAPLSVGRIGSSGGISFARASDGSPQGFIGYASSTNSNQFNIVSGGGGSVMTFTTGGSEKMRIDNGGNVGIGTTTPGNRLEVATGVNEATLIGNQSAALATLGLSNVTSGIGFRRASDGAVTNAIFNYGDTGGTPSLGISFREDFSLFNIAGASRPFTVKSNGNVGIGSTTPGSTLSVVGMAGVNAPNFTVSSSSNAVQFTVLSGGNVGIGTTSPSTLLSLGAQTANIKFSVFDAGGSSLYGLGAASGNLTFGAAIASNGTPQMVLTNAGNVGIGTTTPTTALSVVRTSGSAAISSFGQVSASAASDVLVANNIGSQFQGAQAKLQVQRGGSLGQGWNFLIANDSTGVVSEAMRIANSGNVGIGTTTPLSLLSLYGATSQLGFSNSSGANMYVGLGSGSSPDGIVYLENSANMKFYTAATERMRITSTGNVGIGTTTPTSNLFVQGFGTNPSFTVASSTGVAQLTVLANGNVGIGSASPTNPLFVTGPSAASLLHLQGSGASIATFNRTTANSNVAIEFRNNTASWYAGQSSNGNFSFHTNSNLSNGSFNITTGGNIGIGTATATQRLVVEGNVAPSIDSAYDLGTSTSRWNTLYVNNIDSTGTLAVTNASTTNATTTNFSAENASITNAVLTNATSTNFFTTILNAVTAAFTNLTTLGTTTLATAGGGVSIGTTSLQGMLTLGSGQITAPKGSSSAPTYAFNGDLATGMYSDALGTVNIATGGVNRATINSTGLSMGNASGAILQYANASMTQPTLSPSKVDLDTGIGGDGADTLSLITAGASRMMINAAGNVGIGTNLVNDSKFKVSIDASFIFDGYDTSDKIASISGAVVTSSSIQLGNDGVCGSYNVIGPDGFTYGTVVGADGKCWLDRNLGASRVAIAFNDSQAYGHLYQWGRGLDGHQIRTSGTTSTLSGSDTPGHGDFITSSVAPLDWRSPQNGGLWQGVNGVNNMCPAGFRLPTSSEWSTLVSSAGITNSATAYSSSLKLTVAGYRDRTTAALTNVGSSGNYWSSTVSGPNAVYLNFVASTVNPANVFNRGFGFSVRCVKD